MASNVHVARVGIFNVDTYGNRIDKNNSLTPLSQLKATRQEALVIYDSNIANTASYPTIKAYIEAESNDGFGLIYMDSSFIITSYGASVAGDLPVLNYRTTGLSIKQQVKSASGSVYGWNFINLNTNDVFVKLYDGTSGSVTVGTSTPIDTICVPAASGGSAGIFYQDVGSASKYSFSTGLTIACVTGIADSSTALPSTPIYASIRYL